MRYGKFKLALGTLLLVPALLFSQAPAFADVNDFTVTDFSADYTLTNTDPQGEMRIIEQISVDFTDQNHGILRAIPDTYKGQKLGVQINGVGSPTGAYTQYTTYEQNGNTILKIGLPDKTVTGAQEYVVDYTVHNVIGFYKDHDELYWNVNGDQWQQNFEHVNVTLHIPPGARLSHSDPTCYTGGFGSTTQACVMGQDDKVVTSRTTGNLPAGQTLTFVVGFNKGYFHPLSIWQKLINHWQILVGLIGIPLVVTFFSWLLWWKRGRDARVRSVIIPEYGPPDNLTPLDVGTIVDFKVDNRDLTAGIISLAIRGYLKIIESRKDHLVGKDTFSYTLQLTKPELTGLSSYDTQLLTGLFKDFQQDALVEVSGLKNSLSTISKQISEAVESDLTSRGYFRANPLKSGKVLLVVAIICGGSVYILGGVLGPALGVGLAISAVVAWIFSSKMPARTTKGVTARNHILGLKLYLQVAEKDRLAKLQGPNAAYAANAGEPVKTVDLFEKLLPYAMVLGVERQWARQFEGLYTQPPNWYNGNMNSFGAYYLASNLSDSFAPAIGTTFTAPHSSGSSGFGGGGFAGGGGGGGGGGGW